MGNLNNSTGRRFFNYQNLVSRGFKPQISFPKFAINYSKLKFPAGIIVLSILILGVGIYFLSKPANVTTTALNSKAELVPAKSTAYLNKEFSFPLLDDKGKEVSKLKFTIENAELRDQIIVKGQRASSVQGRTFLILNLKISNELDKPASINSRDYIRLSVNGNQTEWLAADIHNDPVEVQAQSVKYTRVGFPINEADKDLKIRVGEINGEKSITDLVF